MELRVNDLSVSLGGAPILRHVSLAVEDGAFLALLGPSGGGKSTLLKAVAGLVPLTGGQVLLGGRDVTALPTHRRGAVIVFQDLRLFPHMTAAENVAFPLKMRGVDRRQRLERAEALLERVQLPGCGRRRIDTLSGGQQQRVALARALAAEPALLLLDEPFSSLDEDLREDMRELVLSLHREFAATTILVTHDQREALAMSDQVALLLEGELIQQGTPEAVYGRPVSRRAADYFGGCAYLAGRVEDGTFTSPCLTCSVELPPGRYHMLLRPAAVDLARPGPLALRLTECRFRGADTLTRWVTADGTALDIPLQSPPPWPVGHTLRCRVDLSNAIFYPDEEAKHG